MGVLGVTQHFSQPVLLRILLLSLEAGSWKTEGYFIYNFRGQHSTFNTNLGTKTYRKRYRVDLPLTDCLLYLIILYISACARF